MSEGSHLLGARFLNAIDIRMPTRGVRTFCHLYYSASGRVLLLLVKCLALSQTFQKFHQNFHQCLLCEALVDAALRSCTNTQAITEALGGQLSLSYLQYFVQIIVHFVHILLHSFHAPLIITKRPDMTCLEPSQRPKFVLAEMKGWLLWPSEVCGIKT